MFFIARLIEARPATLRTHTNAVQIRLINSDDAYILGLGRVSDRYPSLLGLYNKTPQFN